MQQVDAARPDILEPDDPAVLEVTRNVVWVLAGYEPEAYGYDKQGWLDILDFEGVSEHVAIDGKTDAAWHARRRIYEYATDMEYRQ